MSENQQQWTETIESDHSLLSLNLKEVWHYKDLVYMFVKRDFVSSFKQTVLGPIWFFINPIFTTLVYLIVFGNIANLPNRQFVNDASYRRVSFLLGMGIFFMPYIFAWFTLRQGYSRQARMISFFWLIILVLPTFFKN